MHHGKREVHSVWTNTRNIAFVPDKAEIGTLPSKGPTKGKPDHYDYCHRRVRSLDGNHGALPSKGLHNCLLRKLFKFLPLPPTKIVMIQSGCCNCKRALSAPMPASTARTCFW